jgi:hypothetical protein
MFIRYKIHICLMQLIINNYELNLDTFQKRNNFVPHL